MNIDLKNMNMTDLKEQILKNLDKKKSRFVGVLVQPSKKELEKFSKLNLDYFQLYGNYNDDQILNSYKKIMKKIHPDKNPELNRLAVIVNQAKDTLIKSAN